ncbi:MAG: fasciclin domain-containing protein [Bacteroidota bacterium]
MRTSFTRLATSLFAFLLVASLSAPATQAHTTLPVGTALGVSASIPTEAVDDDRRCSSSKRHDDIVEIAAGSRDFETLVAALRAADLVKTLRGDGPFTVFAPTDEAFARLPHGTVEALLEPENRHQLVDILTLHVVEGEIFSDDLLGASSARTVNGQRLPVGLRIGNANVIQADIEASNGVIHVIDRVLLPE